MHMKYEIWAIILLIIAGLIVDWYFSARDRRKILGPKQKSILVIASLLFILPSITNAQTYPPEGWKPLDTPCTRGNCSDLEEAKNLYNENNLTSGYEMPDECTGVLLTRSMMELVDGREVNIYVKIGIKVEGWHVGFLDWKVSGESKAACVRTTEIWINRKLAHEFKEEFPLKKKN
jgi:hypothetical protein